MVSQLYFEGDELCESDPWCNGADDRILSLEEDANGLIGEIDLIMEGIDLSTNLGQRNKAIIETLYSCGLRVSELTNT